MQQITSRENSKIKLARKVRDGREKNLIFVEGLRLAKEALRSNLEIVEIFFAEHFKQRENFSVNCAINEVSDKLFESLADTETSQGIALVCEKPKANKETFETKVSENKLPVVLFLYEINNPLNLGAILRTAEAVDAAGVIISKNSADVFSPKSLRASMGAALRLNIWTNADFDEALQWSHKNNLIPTAADIKAEKSYLETDWKKPRLLIFGSEAHGLGDDLLGKIKETLFIPMENEVESLNLAVSCGIILLEAKRQKALFD
jgi:TrmH family RNA methyltransferase